MNHKEKKAKKQEPDFFSWENLRSLGVLAVIIFAIRWTVISPYHVPTPSMEPTIKVGDRLVVSKLNYEVKFPFTNFVLAKTGEVKRGDIIVFIYPENPDLDYVKRVVGIAGDKLRLVNDILYINDEPQPREPHEFDRSILEDIFDHPETKKLYRENLHGVEHWVMTEDPEHRRMDAGNYPDNDRYMVVPPDSVFVMGDNRDNSDDSRRWGKVPLSYVKGKALFVLWSAQDLMQFKFRFNRFGYWFDSYNKSQNEAKK